MSDLVKDLAAAQPLPPEEEPAWRAPQAWAGTAGLILVSLCVNNFGRLAGRESSTIRDWLTTPSGRLGFEFIRIVSWFLVAFLAAQSHSLRAWGSQAGLTRGPSFGGWLAAWFAVGVGLLELFVVSHAWEPASSPATRAFGHGGGLWFQYVFSAVVLAPFCEEAVMRGFLYRAFRGSYTLALSTALVVVIFVGWFHWGLLSMPLSALCLAASTVGLCLLREWTGSTWNCVLFHAAYNATVTLRWPFLVGGMLLVLPLCLSRKDKPESAAVRPP